VVEPTDIDRCQCLRDNIVRQLISEWQLSVLQKLPSQENSPVAETVRGYKIASLGLLAVMDVLPNTIYASEALFAYVSSSKRLPKNYVPFVRHTSAPSFHSEPANLAHEESLSASRTARKLA